MTRVVVTRPAAQAAAWVARLHRQGVDAVALPLIEIAASASRDRDAAAAWATLASRRLVVFVSPNAVAHFFAARPATAAWPAGTSAAAPGPATADALRAAGVAAEAIVAPAVDAERFDSEALWAELGARQWQGASVLVVRGDGGREWLAERLVERGARVDNVAVYARGVPVLAAGGTRALVDALASPEAIWLLSSSEAIDNLERLLDRVEAPPSAIAIATHPRIAARARDSARFARVVECRAGFDDVVGCIQSIAARP